MRQRWRLRGRAATFDYFPSKFYCIQATCNYLNIRNKKDGAIASRKSSRREERERSVFWKVRDVTRWRKEAATNFKILPLWPATRPQCVASCVRHIFNEFLPPSNRINHSAAISFFGEKKRVNAISVTFCCIGPWAWHSSALPAV